MSIARVVLIGLCPFSLFSVANADVVVLSEAKHGTLYENPGEELANGLGQYFFAGVNNQTRIRRGLIAFDLAPLSGLPIEINSVTVRLHCSQGNPGGNAVSLNRVISDWGVGSSDASGGEGSGAAATPNSATWNYAFYDTTAWANPGGDYSATSSASTIIDGTGWYEWSSPELISDLESWLAGSVGSFGWELLGNEATNGTAQRFDSALLGNALFHPELVVDYTEIPGPGSVLVSFILTARSRRRR